MKNTNITELYRTEPNPVAQKPHESNMNDCNLENFMMASNLNEAREC